MLNEKIGCAVLVCLIAAFGFTASRNAALDLTMTADAGRAIVAP